ncbi:27660_t:CDS:2, partial [Dentiscutata erythropus]
IMGPTLFDELRWTSILRSLSLSDLQEILQNTSIGIIKSVYFISRKNSTDETAMKQKEAK